MRVFSFFLLLLLLSCSKSRRTEKRLEGTWKATFVKVENGEGFTLYDSTPKGIINFNSFNKSGNGKIYFVTKNISGLPLQDSLDLNMIEYTIFSENNQLKVYRVSDTINFRIVQLTLFDLQLEYYEYSSFSLKKITFQKIN